MITTKFIKGNFLSCVTVWRCVYNGGVNLAKGHSWVFVIQQFSISDQQWSVLLAKQLLPDSTLLWIGLRTEHMTKGLALYVTYGKTITDLSENLLSHPSCIVWLCIYCKWFVNAQEDIKPLRVLVFLKWDLSMPNGGSPSIRLCLSVTSLQGDGNYKKEKRTWIMMNEEIQM